MYTFLFEQAFSIGLHCDSLLQLVNIGVNVGQLGFELN